MARIAALILSVAALAPAASQARPLPTFDVGTATVDITPTTPQFLGGYDHMRAPTAAAHDPLEVRAFFVGRGSAAVAFAIVDSQGWFAGYQEGPFGITDARAQAARALRALGYEAGPANLIVSSTHSHAAPTIMGIWGPTDPAYLQRVHDATVQAVVSAARSARPAELWTAGGSIEQLIAHNLEGTDSFDGWGIDDRASLLWAREPGTGATLGIYANVPVHADQYRGSKYGLASADYPGAARVALEGLLGGTAVVAMGTLGRQEAMGGINDYSEVERQGRFIVNAITRGLARARPVTDPVVAGAQQYVAVPAHNAALLALLYGNVAGLGCENPLENCPIDRSIVPPYLGGNVIGTWVTALRIGDAIWVSQPGEAFNDVTRAIRASIPGASEVNVVGMAQDQLGYYYPPEDYPASQLNPSDFILFNVSPTLADQSVDAGALAARRLGFRAVPRHPMMDVEDPEAFFHAGTQFWPSVVESADPTRELLVNGKPSQAPTLGQHTVSPIHVDFGDGSPPIRVVGEQRLTHTFPGPGSYPVTVRVTDESGYERRYRRSVIVDPPPVAVVRRIPRGSATLLSVGVRGGDGRAIAAHWSFADGTTADGLRIARPGTATTSGAVTVVDGAGDTATTIL